MSLNRPRGGDDRMSLKGRYHHDLYNNAPLEDESTSFWMMVPIHCKMFPTIAD